MRGAKTSIYKGVSYNWIMPPRQRPSDSPRTPPAAKRTPPPAASPPATCHAPTGYTATCHTPTGRTATCHAPTGRPTCHAPTGRPAASLFVFTYGNNELWSLPTTVFGIGKNDDVRIAIIDEETWRWPSSLTCPARPGHRQFPRRPPPTRGLLSSTFPPHLEHFLWDTLCVSGVFQ